MGQPAQLQIGGRSYQVVSSASQQELDKLAARVERALATENPGGNLRAERSILLAALRLAHEAEEAEARRIDERARHQEQLSGYLKQLNQLLGLDETPSQGRRAPARRFEIQSLVADEKQDDTTAETMPQSPFEQDFLAAADPWTQEAPRENAVERKVRSLKDHPRKVKKD